MVSSSRWTIVDDETAPVSAVATRTLRKRLDVVWSDLQAASARQSRDAERARDAERVHHLRVATRRALAAIEAFRDLLPTKQRAWFEKHLRRIRRAAGDARDLDVLTERLAATPPAETGRKHASDGRRARQRLVTMLSKQREVSREPIIERREKLVDNDWPGRVVRLLESIPGGRRQPSFGDYARRQFRPMVERFFAAADRKLRDPDEIHRLRIEGKKIRYSLEIFAVVFPSAERARCHDALDRLQKTLGSFTDHTAAAERFERWAEGTAAASNRQLLARLRREEVELADKARRVFVKWWNPSRRRALRRRFERTLGRCSA